MTLETKPLDARNVICSHTCVPDPKLSMTLRVGNLRRAIAELSDDAFVRIMVYSDVKHDAAGCAIHKHHILMEGLERD